IKVDLNPRDSVMTNAKTLSTLGWGGTNCSAPLLELNKHRAKVDLVVFISDNESWIDSCRGDGGTALMREWEILKSRNPSAKLVCIDIQPYGTAQAVSRRDILNIGGFSDAVFSAVSAFAKAPINGDFWVNTIESVDIDLA
ncbi:MAG: RNA-binding protein, partial [Verrucomicrobiota bacterium]